MTELSLTKPMASFYGFTEEGDEVQKTKSEADKIVISIEKKDDAGGNIIPFDISDASKTSLSDGKEASALPESVTIANDVLSRTRLIEYLNKNNHHCACCNKSLRTVPVSQAHLIEHFDREEGMTNIYMMCSRGCHEDMKLWTTEIDEEYSCRLGNIANDQP